MRAVVYSELGGPEVLRLVERPLAEPGEGDVRVRIAVSGVNPTDWKLRRGSRGGGIPFPEIVPHQDGAGIIDAVGPKVDPARVGERVWLWEAAWGRPDGTAQEYVVLPERQAVHLPDEASFDLGATLGIPALTAHRCLTIGETGPDRLTPGALTSQVVLVAGGAGAVGHAAIQLASWAGARVLATVSSPNKAALASAAGAQATIDYRRETAAEEIREFAPDGVDVIVEVSPAVNAALDLDVLAPNGTVSGYATDGGGELHLPIYPRNGAQRPLSVHLRVHSSGRSQGPRDRRRRRRAHCRRDDRRRGCRPPPPPVPPRADRRRSRYRRSRCDRQGSGRRRTRLTRRSGQTHSALSERRAALLTGSLAAN